jgi:hypothetical protein
VRVIRLAVAYFHFLAASTLAVQRDPARTLVCCRRAHVLFPSVM